MSLLNILIRIEIHADRIFRVLVVVGKSNASFDFLLGLPIDRFIYYLE